MYISENSWSGVVTERRQTTATQGKREHSITGGKQDQACRGEPATTARQRKEEDCGSKALVIVASFCLKDRGCMCVCVGGGCMCVCETQSVTHSNYINIFVLNN